MARFGLFKITLRRHAISWWPLLCWCTAGRTCAGRGKGEGDDDKRKIHTLNAKACGAFILLNCDCLAFCFVYFFGEITRAIIGTCAFPERSFCGNDVDRWMRKKKADCSCLIDGMAFNIIRFEWACILASVLALLAKIGDFYVKETQFQHNSVGEEVHY